MQKHSTWGVLSQGRNSKELTARETNGGTLGFNRRQRLKPYQYLYVENKEFQIFVILYLCKKIPCFFQKKVILKASEGKRPRPEQVEGWRISALEDRTRDCGKSLGGLGSRSERLIKLANS